MRVGQAHCYFFDIDGHGRTTREAFHERWRQLRRDRPPTLNYKAQLAHEADVINHLSAYRKAIIEELGGFNERIRSGIEYDMARRLLDRSTIKLVPEFLYCRRIHRDNTTTLRFKNLRGWASMDHIRRELVRAQKVRS